MARDDFLAKVVGILRTRVAHRCSNPDCRTSTVGPGNGPLAVANIGKAAHIAAASPGGPRYVEDMTKEERSSIDNAIWLCSNCATKIDVAPDVYPIPLLQAWKRLAEQTADSEKGTRLPRIDDARNQLISVMGGMPASFMFSAIQNTHEATEQVLQALDPRFCIETSYKNKKTVYQIQALETVQAKLYVPPALINEWQVAMQGLFEHGRDVALPSNGLVMEGSPLFEQILSRDGCIGGTFHIESQKKSAILKLRTIDPETHIFEQFDDLLGHVRFGLKSLTFEGSSCGGLLQLSCHMHNSPLTNKLDITLSTNHTIWERRDIRYLPHFDKLFKLFDLIENGWKIEVSLEIEGIQVLQAKDQIPKDTEFFRSVHVILHYIVLIRKIARYLDVAIHFSSDGGISKNDFSRALEVVEIIDGRYRLDKSACKSNITCELVVQDNANNIRQLLEREFPGPVVFRAHDREEFFAFGQTIQLPIQEIRLEGVRAKISHSNLSEIKDGEAVSIEWEPSENFQYSKRYLKEEQELDEPTL